MNLNLPLSFWFTNMESEEEIQNRKERNKKLIKLDDEAVNLVAYCRENQDSWPIDMLFKYDELLNDIGRRRAAISRPIFIFPFFDPYGDLRSELNRMSEKKSPTWFRIPIVLNKTEQVNGFLLERMEDSVDEQYFPYSYFLKLEELFNTPNTMTKEEFIDKFDHTVCTDWGKQDENGECFGGFWKYPEGSYEHVNAHALTQQANGAALFNLPYSHALILETIELGCRNRRESVKYSNSVCEYVKRKLANKRDC